MLGNLLKLGNIEVIDIMVPRADIVAIPINSTLESTLQPVFKSFSAECLSTVNN